MNSCSNCTALRASALIECALRRSIADHVAQALARRCSAASERAVPKPPRWEMSMAVIGVTAPGHRC